MENDLVIPDLPPLVLVHMEKRSELHEQQYSDPLADLLTFLNEHGTANLIALRALVQEVHAVRDTARLLQQVSRFAGAPSGVGAVPG